MSRLCPTCAKPLSPQTRAQFCPLCSLRGALEVAGEEGIEPETPESIGDYDLLDVLGRGGGGVVYRAQQRSLGRLVAVKLLAAGAFASEDARRRFHAEATAIAALRHANIVTVYETGEHGGQPFFSMELVAGGTLADLTRDGPLSAREAATLLKAVAEAVQFAHRQGVLHRDLKPSNILLDDARVPRVSDFGIARQLDAADRLTLTGDVLGSPAYLAPEQACGDRAREGVTSDVYSLGAILYQLLCGRPPFLGDSPQSVLRQVTEAVPIAPRYLNPGVPLDLETICVKCLEKEPARRYASAQELADDLGRFLNREPVRARPVGPVGRAWRYAQRHPARAGLIGALAVLLVVLAVVPTLAYLRVRRAEHARETQLRETLIMQARAVRLGGRPGQRVESLKALHEAASLGGVHPTATIAINLRNETIASLAINDAFVVAAADLPAEADPTYLSVSSTGEIIARSSVHGPVQILRRADGHELQRLDLGGRKLQHVLDFDATGRYLAIRHGDDIAIWDLTNRAIAIAQPSWLNRYSFRSDSGAVAFLRTNGSVAGFSLPEGRELWQWSERSTNSRGALAFAPDGKRLAWGVGGIRGIEVRAAGTGELLRSFAFGGNIRAVTWSANGQWLAAGDASGQVRIWEIGAAEHSWSFEAHSGAVCALAFSPDGQRLLSSGLDETVRVLDVLTGRAGLTVQGTAFQLGFHPSGTRAGPIWQGEHPRWIALTNSDVFTAWRAEAQPSAALSVALDATARLLAVTRGAEVRVWEQAMMRPVATLPCDTSSAVYFTADGHLLAVGLNHVTRWTANRETGGPITFAPPEKLLTGTGGAMASFTADGATMALADFLRSTAQLLPTAGGKIQREFRHDRIAAVALSPNGKRLVTAELDHDPIRVWNVATGEIIREWPAAGDLRVVFSPDGRWLAQFGLKCRLWDAESWQPGPALPSLPRNSALGGAAFSSDGQMLAVSAADHEIHLLSFPDLKPLAVLEAPYQLRINQLAWSGDGSHLAAATMQGEVQVWRLNRLREQLRGMGME